jgi:hypothetical protein
MTTRLRELNTANLRLNENIGNFNNVLTSHEKSLLLSCVNAAVDKYNELAKEPTKYPKAQQMAGELYKLCSKIKYKL